MRRATPPERERGERGRGEGGIVEEREGKGVIETNEDECESCEDMKKRRRYLTRGLSVVQREWMGSNERIWSLSQAE
jgi:hypothetical protein